MAQNLSFDLDNQLLVQPSVTTFQDNTLVLSDHLTEKTSSGIFSPSTSHSQQVKHATPSHSQHEKPSPPPMSVNTFSILVDSQSTPSDTQIMESFHQLLSTTRLQ